MNDLLHSLASKFCTLMLFKLQKSNEKFSASLYQIYRTDTGHDFSLYFAYELLMNFRNYDKNNYNFIIKHKHDTLETPFSLER